MSTQFPVLNPTERYIKALREQIAALQDELSKRRLGVIQPSATDAIWASLTDKQQRMVDLIVKGHSIAHIAHELGHSRQSMKNMLCRLYKKVGVHGRSELAARMLARNVKPQSEP